MSMDDGFATIEDACAFICEHAGDGYEAPADLVNFPEIMRHAYRAAAKRLHPDVAGDAEAFKKLQQAKSKLDREVIA